MLALDATKHYWSEYYKYDLVTDLDEHAKSYFPGYAAWMVQYRQGLRFLDLTLDNPSMEVILDEPVASYDIPKGSYADLKFNLIHVKSIARMYAGTGYCRSLRDPLNFLGKDERTATFLGKIVRYEREAELITRRHGGEQLLGNGLDITKDAGFKVWFPLQKEVAEWMGDTKVKRLHQELISREQIEEMRATMEPGDVLVARHNWYLSNIGLPGFWPHAELYVGDQEELDAYFQGDEALAGWLVKNGGDPSLSAHLARRFPKAWAVYTSPDDAGDPRRVIEAISEGVSLTSLEHAAGCDYVGAMRPRQSKLAKLQAIARAFELYGKPYDFNFDFLTDESLVCTELVYKAWQPAEGKPGPKVGLVKVMGRTTLPANDLVRQFDEQHGTEQQQLDFVYFLDGREKVKGALVSDLDSFRASWKRPKWDVLQE
jgi:hypothetical protein